MKKLLSIWALSALVAYPAASLRYPGQRLDKYIYDSIFLIGQYPALSLAETNDFISHLNRAERLEDVDLLRFKARILNSVNEFLDGNAFFKERILGAKSMPALIDIEREADAAAVDKMRGK